jgi:uncharacterized protein (TIGR00251 family)
VAEGIQLRVRAAPGAGKDALAGLHEGAIRVRVAARAVEGEANRAILRFLAREVLGIAPSSLSLLRGETGRDKLILARGDAAALEARLQAALAPTLSSGAPEA